MLPSTFTVLKSVLNANASPDTAPVSLPRTLLESLISYLPGSIAPLKLTSKPPPFASGVIEKFDMLPPPFWRISILSFVSIPVSTKSDK